MPFDSGNISLAICRIPRELPEDVLDLFIAKAAGPLANVAELPKIGWVTGRHMLDTNLTQETAFTAGYLHLVLRTAQRKIPPSLFKAECAVEELAMMQALNTQRLSRKQKKEIKDAINDRLIKQMPPTLSGIAFVADPATQLLYVACSAVSKLDGFLGEFGRTVELDPIHLGPEAAAEHLFGVNPLDISALTFSPEVPADDSDNFLGRDFATWLWYFQEIGGGVFQVERLGAFAVAIDGPLTFVGETSSAVESVVRKGTPTNSAEAKAALLVGKKLKKAKFTIARANDNWTFTLDAENFLFSGLTLPPGESLDANSHFQERIMLIHDFREAFFTLFKKYLDHVTDETRHDKLQRGILDWVSEMNGH